MADSGKDYERELAAAKTEASLREGVRKQEDETFLRKHKEEVAKNIPLAEQFLFEFARQYLRPFTEEEDNSLVSMLDLTQDGEIDFLKIVNDAFKLAEIDKLKEVVDTSRVSGYEAEEGTRNFQTNMMFLNIHGEVGADGLLALVQGLSGVYENLKVNKAALQMDNPPGTLQYLITREGKIFTPTPAENQSSSSGGIATAPSESEASDFEHSEGEEENNKHYMFSLMIGWDIENSLSVFITAYGNEGLIGQGINMRFSFQSAADGTNQFPTVPKGATRSEVTYSPDKSEINCRFVEKSTIDNSEYEARQKYIRLGKINTQDEREVVVWGNNGKWNSFGPIESSN